MAVLKKKFFEIQLPLINQKAELQGTSEEKLVGKTIKIDLTRKLRGKSLEIIFKIKSEEEKIKAEDENETVRGEAELMLKIYENQQS